ncbi:MAG: glycosyl transferase family protein [Pseudomonadales bacterium]
MNNNEHSFAPFVRTLGKGKTGSRSLTTEEAYSAMQMILEGAVEDVQLGAFLMLLRVKEETAEELTGFVRAVRDWIGAVRVSVDLDWSSYAGKRQQLPWFLLSALCLCSQGYRIFMHGTRGHTTGRMYTEDVLHTLRWPIASNWNEVQHALRDSGFAFMPLQSLCAPLQRLINFRSQLGLRSPVHTLCRLLNPLRAECSLQSVFHPSYAGIHQHAAQMLGHKNLAIIKGDGGECELRPQADTDLYLLQDGTPQSGRWQRQLLDKPKASAMNMEQLVGVWRGSDSDSYAEQATVGTLALAFSAINQQQDQNLCMQQARQCWESRNIGLL